MIANIAGRFTGYLQIHAQGYWDNRSLDQSIGAGDSLPAKLAGFPGVEGLVPRLEGFALASTGDLTTGAMVVGIDPAAENALSGVAEKITGGRYLRQGDSGALVAEGLSRRLGLDVGDTLVLLGQGYHGATAAGRFPIRGRMHFASPDLNDRLVYLGLRAAQELFAAPGRLTAYIVRPRPGADLRGLARALPAKLGKGYEAMSWEEMLPDLKQVISADRAGFLIMLGVLYLVVAFGIFGTLLMMTYERRREFGVLLAVGMRRRRLAAMLLLESLLLGGLGAAAGVAGSLPVVYWLAVHPIRFSGQAAEAYARFGLEPIFPATLRLAVLVQQGLWIFAVAALLSLAPVWRAFRIRPLEAMRK
jgi:ABC-type lipoprotein release transport system permease subunit